jgi:hypothetical protein
MVKPLDPCEIYTAAARVKPQREMCCAYHQRRMTRCTLTLRRRPCSRCTRRPTPHGSVRYRAHAMHEHKAATAYTMARPQCGLYRVWAPQRVGLQSTGQRGAGVRASRTGGRRPVAAVDASHSARLRTRWTMRGGLGAAERTAAARCRYKPWRVRTSAGCSTATAPCRATATEGAATVGGGGAATSVGTTVCCIGVGRRSSGYWWCIAAYLRNPSRSGVH